MGRPENAKRGQCRIIAGKWRGRVISFDDAEGLRPTTDRIRETVFNWLQTYLSQSRCLDCFAGSGALGFEALSRGAAKVDFIEQNKKSVSNLKKNIAALDIEADKVSIVHHDAQSWLQANSTPKNQYDVIFLDPPFDSDLLEKSCTLLNSSGCLAADTIIYVEHSKKTEIKVPTNWRCLKEKTSGEVSYKLFTHSS